MAQRLLRRRQASQLELSRDERREVLSEVTVVDEDEASEMAVEAEAAAAI